MNSKILLQIKNRLKALLSNKEILDIIIFGSAIKGKTEPRDIDIALITRNIKPEVLEGFHISILSPDDFFINPPNLINTLLREGYSLKHNKNFAEVYRFSNRVLFKYELKGMKPSEKVMLVNFLRGKKSEKGLVKENNGEWLANQIFVIPTENEFIFEKFFLNKNVKFNKFYVLMH
jgi:predicted nucleotidyltransferase